MDIKDFKIDLLKQEIELIQSKINHFDDLRLKTKNMAIIIWTVIVGFAIKENPMQVHWMIFILATIIPWPFWYIEADFRRTYKGWNVRFWTIRNFLRDGEVSVAIAGNSGKAGIASLKDLLDSYEKIPDFAIPEYWPSKTLDPGEKENVNKWKKKQGKSKFASRKAIDPVSIWRNIIRRELSIIYGLLSLAGAILLVLRIFGLLNVDSNHVKLLYVVMSGVKIR